MMNKKFILIQAVPLKASYKVTRLQGQNKSQLSFRSFEEAREFLLAMYIEDTARIIHRQDFKKAMGRTELFEAEIRALSTL